MSESDIWSVDRIAASNLVVNLGMAFKPEQIERIANHFALHRQNSAKWVAERVHSNIVKALEEEAIRLSQRHGDEWSQGYMRAEQVMMTLPINAMMDIERHEPKSKGQILRAMVRQAKRQ